MYRDNKETNTRKKRSARFRAAPTVLLTGLLAVFFACATTPPASRAPFEKSKTVPGSCDTVWDALLEIAASEGERITMIQKDSGVISFQKTIASGDIVRYARNNGGLLWNEVEAHVIVIARHAGEGRTGLTINVKIIGTGKTFFDIFLYRTRQVFLESTGVLETEYFTELGKRLAAAPSP